MKCNRGVNFKFLNDEMKFIKWNDIRIVILSFIINFIFEFGILFIDGRLVKIKR